jgi:hypothetical protein
MFERLVEQYPYLIILSGVISGVIIIGMFSSYRLLRTRELQRHGYRNVWDTALFPGISKLFWTGGWPTVFATGLLILVALLALIAEQSMLWDAFKVNLGLVLGTLLRTMESKIPSKEGSPSNAEGKKG